MVDNTKVGDDFPDIVGGFMARSMIQEFGSIFLIVSHVSGAYRILFNRAMFLFADIEIGESPPRVVSCAVTDRPERRDALRKKVEIKLDCGTLAIGYDKCVYVKSERADEAAR